MLRQKQFAFIPWDSKSINGKSVPLKKGPSTFSRNSLLNNFDSRNIFILFWRAHRCFTSEKFQQTGDIGESLPVWKITMAFRQSGIVEKHLVRLRFSHYHRFASNNISQRFGKFGTAVNWKICCVWANGQNFGNFEESPSQRMSFDEES